MVVDRLPAAFVLPAREPRWGRLVVASCHAGIASRMDCHECVDRIRRRIPVSRAASLHPLEGLGKDAQRIDGRLRGAGTPVRFVARPESTGGSAADSDDLLR